jgi:hypothetical protein
MGAMLKKASCRLQDILRVIFYLSLQLIKNDEDRIGIHISGHFHNRYSAAGPVAGSIASGRWQQHRIFF